MGRFDLLTQLDKKQPPEAIPERPDGEGGKKRSPTPPAVKPQTQVAQESAQSQAPVPEPIPEPVPVGVRGGVPPSIPRTPKVKRLIRQRQPFDIYEDQYERLKTIAAEEKDFENGRGMSQMVRLAIDNYLKDHGIPQE
jgi:hypothetical protein